MRRCQPLSQRNTAFTRQRLRFASLQSQGHADDSSIVLIDASGSEWRRSDAVIGVLRRLGGYWWLLAQALRAVPRALRDAGYDAVGRLRYRLGTRLATDACPRLPPALAHLGSLEFSKQLLTHAQVAVAPGVGYGENGEGFVRIALSVDKARLAEAFDRMAKHSITYDMAKSTV